MNINFFFALLLILFYFFHLRSVVSVSCLKSCIFLLGADQVADFIGIVKTSELFTLFDFQCVRFSLTRICLTITIRSRVRILLTQ